MKANTNRVTMGAVLRGLCCVGVAGGTGCAADESDDMYLAVADVPELMGHVLEPAAEVYWDAVGWILDENGTHEIRPSNEEEWEAVVSAAFVVAESGNLLMMDGRSLDDGPWMVMSRALIEVGRRAVEVAEARDEQGVFDVGAEVYMVCTNCHSTYALETLRPNERADAGDPGGS